MGAVHEILHPLVQHKLTLLRKRDTGTTLFRSLVGELGMLMAYEVTRDLPTRMERIETPLMETEAVVLDGKKLVLVSILRAGDGLLQGMLQILPSARVAHFGVYRDEETLQAREYYFRVPAHMPDREVVLLDPMLATGASATAAVERIQPTGPRSIKLVCLLAAPEGIEAFHARHPGVPIYCAKIDRRLNDKAYIVPGLGDAGDRIFGTG